MHSFYWLDTCRFGFGFRGCAHDSVLAGADLLASCTFVPVHLLHVAAPLAQVLMEQPDLIDR